MLSVHADPTGVVRVELREPTHARDLSRLRSQLAKSLPRGRGGVTVDVSALDHISSPTIAALLWARRSCVAHRVPFSVVGQSQHNSKLLLSCGLVSELGSVA